MVKYCKIGDGLVNEEWLRRLALLVYERVLEDGGDGGGTILCHYFDHREVADILEPFFVNETSFKTKTVDPNHQYVTFSDGPYGQESVTIQQEEGPGNLPPLDSITVII